MGQFPQQQIFRHPEATSWLSLLRHLLWAQDKKPHEATGDLTAHDAAELRQNPIKLLVLRNAPWNTESQSSHTAA